MFSGIYSLFGKKHHHHHHHNDQSSEDTSLDKTPSTESDFIVVDRRHSDDIDMNTPGLYPNINPMYPPVPGGHLPYGVSPSLPDLRPSSSIQKTAKEGQASDILHGVPFELASYIELVNKKEDEKFKKILERSRDGLTEDLITDKFNYDFDLEEKILGEYRT